jgi:Protein of unknown function (DUF3147)
MKVKIDPAELARVKWYEYAIRFLFGGAVTAIAGVIAKRFGPVAGGLFLSFPAILPASATLIEKHEIQKKRRAGIDGRSRGRQAAALDAAGAAMGSFGLMLFGLTVWELLPPDHGWKILAFAIFVWFVTAVGIWWSRETARRLLRRS